MEQIIAQAGGMDPDMKDSLLSALDKPLPQFNKIFGDAQQENRSLRDNLKRKKEEKQATEQELRRQKSENIAMQRQLVQVKQQQEELKQELNSKDGEIEELLGRLKNLKREKEEYKHKAEMEKTRQSVLDWKEKRLAMAQDRFADRAEPSASDRKRMTQLENKARGAEGRIQNLKNAEMKLRAELQSIDTVSKSRSDTLRQMGAKLEEHFDKFNVEMREFQSRERQLRESKRDTEEDLRGAQSQVQQLKAANAAMEQQLNDLSRSLKRERSRSPSKKRGRYAEPFSDITSISSPTASEASDTKYNPVESKLADMHAGLRDSARMRERRRPKSSDRRLQPGSGGRKSGRHGGSAQNLDALRAKFGIAPNRAGQYARGRRQ